MPKRKSSTKSSKKGNLTPIGEPEIWEDKNKISKATVFQKDDGKKAISVRIGTRVGKNSYPRYGKTVWIDENLDLPNWLNWFVRTVKKLYYNVFGKEVLFSDAGTDYYATKIEFLTKQLADTQTKLEEAQLKQEENKRLLELARNTHFNFDEVSKTLEKFRGLIEQSKSQPIGMEEKIKNEIKKSMWLLGLECFVEAKNQDIDIQTEIDLHVKTKYNQDRIFEIKSPHLEPFKRKKENKNTRYTASEVLMDGLSELILYLRRTDIYSDRKTEGTYGIQKASGYIVGYKLDNEQLQLLREFNFHLLPHIQIFTYDDLLNNIDRELSLIKR